MKKLVAVSIAALVAGSGLAGCATKKVYYPPQAYVVEKRPVVERERIYERPPVVEREYVAPR